MSRRTLLALAGWLAAALVATGIGVGAVRVIDTGFNAAGTEVLSPQQVAEQLGAAPPFASASPTVPPSSQPLQSPTHRGRCPGRVAASWRSAWAAGVPAQLDTGAGVRSPTRGTRTL